MKAAVVLAVIMLSAAPTLAESNKLSLSVLGDVGGFGVSSNLTWQAFGGVEYRFAQHWSARAGYRALGIDIDTREPESTPCYMGRYSA